MSERAKKLRRAGRKRKGLEDKHKHSEGIMPMYALAVFGGNGMPLVLASIVGRMTPKLENFNRKHSYFGIV